MSIASLIISGCLSPHSQEDPPNDMGDPTYPPLPPSTSTVSPSPTNDGKNPPEKIIHNSWLQLDELTRVTQNDSSEGDRLMGELVTHHRHALDDLVSQGEINPEAADHVQRVFEEAAYHIWRANAPISCYEALPAEAIPRGDLIQQADLLTDVSDDLDPNTVELIRAAIARDMAFFEAIDQTENQEELLKQFYADELEIGPELLEAVRFLMEVLHSR